MPQKEPKITIDWRLHTPPDIAEVEGAYFYVTAARMEEAWGDGRAPIDGAPKVAVFIVGPNELKDGEVVTVDEHNQYFWWISHWAPVPLPAPARRGP